MQDAVKIGMECAAPDDLSKQTLNALHQVRATMMESRILKTVESSKRPAERIAVLSTEYADEQCCDMLQDICDQLKSFLLSKNYAAKDDNDNLVPLVGGDSNKKEKKEKKKDTGEKVAAADSHKKHKKDKKDKDKKEKDN